MLELLVLASVLQFEGGCCLLRNAPRTPGKDKPHGSSTVEHDAFFLGRTRSGVWKLSSTALGCILILPRNGLLRISIILAPKFLYQLRFGGLCMGSTFTTFCKRSWSQDVSNPWSCMIMYFIGDMSRTAGNQKYYGGSKTWCPSDYWTNMLVLDVHASLALGMHVKFLNTHTYTYTSIYLSIYQSIYIYTYVYICDHMYICIGINL